MLQNAKENIGNNMNIDFELDKRKKIAGSELVQAHLKLGLDFTLL